MNKFPVFTFLTGSLCLHMFNGVIAAPQLRVDSDVSTAGYYQLNWDGESDSNFVLEESTDPEFTQATTLYKGPDTASLISGRSDGTYFYRIRLSSDNPQSAHNWSNVASVEVAHHPLSRAFIFFGIGAVVFIATLAVVMLGNKSQNQ